MGNIIIKEDVAEAIEAYMDSITKVMKRDEETGKGILVAEHCQQDWTKYELGQYSALNDITTFDLMRVLVNGYRVVGRSYETKTTTNIYRKINELQRLLDDKTRSHERTEKELEVALSNNRREREENRDLIKYRVSYRTLVEELSAQKRGF